MRPLLRSYLAVLPIFAAAFIMPPPSYAEAWTEKDSAEIVDAVSAKLDNYFDPTVGKQVKEAIAARRSDFMSSKDRDGLAEQLSAEMLKISHDKHLRVSIASSNGKTLSDEDQNRMDAYFGNGFIAVRRLPGNIGYLSLRNFEHSDSALKAMESALTILKDTYALIIDLRKNGGGGGSDGLLIGHLSKTPIQMETIHWRQPDGSTEIWKREAAKPKGGPLYADKPVYVLTSKKTFSAAEAFTYNLKLAGRATVVGETTGGGANPGRFMDVGHGMAVFVPTGQAVHPTSGGNWEGTGVTPDIAVPENEALVQAYGRALKAVRPPVENPKIEKELAAAIADPHAALAADQGM